MYSSQSTKESNFPFAPHVSASSSLLKFYAYTEAIKQWMEKDIEIEIWEVKAKLNEIIHKSYCPLLVKHMYAIYGNTA